MTSFNIPKTIQDLTIELINDESIRVHPPLESWETHDWRICIDKKGAIPPFHRVVFSVAWEEIRRCMPPVPSQSDLTADLALVLEGHRPATQDRETVFRNNVRRILEKTVRIAKKELERGQS